MRKKYKPPFKIGDRVTSRAGKIGYVVGTVGEGSGELLVQTDNDTVVTIHWGNLFKLRDDLSKNSN